MSIVDGICGFCRFAADCGLRVGPGELGRNARRRLFAGLRGERSQ